MKRSLCSVAEAAGDSITGAVVEIVDAVPHKNATSCGFECVSQKGCKHDTEQSGGQHTSLFDAICN